MSKEVAALLLTLVVHVIGAAALVGALLRTAAPGSWRSWWPQDEDDGGGGGGDGRREPPRVPSPGGDGLPLDDAIPATVRLRAPGRLADAHPRPARRGAPQHTPERTPAAPR